MNEKEITIKDVTNMKPSEFTVIAKLWKGQRWYIDFGRGTNLCLDAQTGVQIKTKKQINNQGWIQQIQKALGFVE